MTKRRKINAREASLYALTKVAEEGAYANLALAEVLSAYTMDSRDRKLATEITYGVITYQLTLDWLIKQITGRPAQKLDRPVLHALRIGFYQLFYLDRIPAPAIVYSTVELIKKGKKRALASFVNGVMRGAIRKKDTLAWPDAKKNPLDYLVLRYSHPPWLVKRWLKRLGRAETEKLLVANNTTPPTSIRVNTLRTDSLQLIASLEQEKITAAPSSIVPDGLVVEKGGKLGALSAYRSGLFQIQGESAMLTSHILQPMPGAKVLDGCSAPGGKTTHLAQLMNNTGQIIALDLYEHRLALVEAAAKRLGIKIIETKCADIARFCPQNREKFD
ncbi:MAG: 16S rRNA (cytosine(967)-C(5))-methyltransferase RsmB [Firmicutes bacterium]|nr:16S rRNA (cytosine(967)-C(5))-methyltransferase RsmB [Bacillota bacterium]